MPRIVSHTIECLRKYAGMITVEPVLFLYMLGLCLYYPVFQAFTYEKICLATYDQNATVCEAIINRKDVNASVSLNLTEEQLDTMENEVQTHSSYWTMYFNIASTVPSIFICIYMGSWSDSFGRKPAMLAPCIGQFLLVVSVLFSLYYKNSWIGYILIGVFLSGFSGQYAALLMSVFSYLADVTDVKSRSVRVAILEAMVPFGSALGVGFGGYLKDHTNYVTVFSIVASLYVLCGLYVVLVVKDRHVPSPQEPVDQQGGFCEKMCHIEHVRQCLQTTFKRRPHNHRVYIILLNLIMFVQVIIFAGIVDVIWLFFKKVLSWTPSEFGYFSATHAILVMLALLILMPVLKQLMKIHDIAIAIMSSFFRMASLLLLAFTTNAWMAYVSVVINIPAALTPAVIRSVLSKLVASDEQGKMFAFLWHHWRPFATDRCSKHLVWLYMDMKAEPEHDDHYCEGRRTGGMKQLEEDDGDRTMGPDAECM
ncbi:PREDICTED: proton-coupled folate transporter-like [Priapulus caudatus]|uniref:Proton-coupled folate transporter-like n=1 Tax=Priapulus caudatus TaxID=37621 RepID=A0ABM1E207_PRICU|nr:PREDICTED: proton-coupled folate transporter-like [Priapulus caudatus]